MFMDALQELCIGYDLAMFTTVNVRITFILHYLWLAIVTITGSYIYLNA